MEDKLIGIDEASKMLEKIKQNIDLSLLEDIVKDNNIEFKYGDNYYRVRLLNREEKEKLDKFRVDKFGELMKNKNIMFENTLIEIYKDKGINIEEIDENIKKLEIEQSNILLKLGEAISKKQGEEVLKTYKENIEKLKDKISLLWIRRNTLLSCSFENQLNNFVVKVTTYLSFEMKVDNNWNKVFKSFEEFEKYQDEKLLEKAGYYSLLLHYRI